MNLFNDMLREREPVTIEYTAVVEFTDGTRDNVTIEMPETASVDEVDDALEHELVRVFGVEDYVVLSVN